MSFAKLLLRWRRGLGSVALAFVLVAAQSGALLHELSHYSQASVGSETPAQKPGHNDKVCDLCLAFAQLAASLHSDAPAAQLLADLRHGGATFRAPAEVEAETPAARSRGPPFLL